jgi:acylpyruvate hydrolase
MKLATFRQADGTTRAGRIEGNEVALLPMAGVGELLSSGSDWQEAAGRAGERIALDETTVTRLINRPSKVYCVGRNYLEHIREGNVDAELPRFPEIFIKFADSLTGAYDDVPLPAGSGCTSVREAMRAAAKADTVSVPMASDFVDWEAELVLVIGTSVRRASQAEAEAAIAGFTVGNDVTVRDWQFHTTQWTQGKAWEAMSPVGPVLVTADDLGVRPDLQIRCLVDDVVMQDSRTSDMLFDPVEIVAYLSRVGTLHPGDMIFTGTPSGVGFARKPQVYLRPGQVLTTEIEGIGRTVNNFVAEELRLDPHQNGSHG